MRPQDLKPGALKSGYGYYPAVQGLGNYQHMVNRYSSAVILGEHIHSSRYSAIKRAAELIEKHGYNFKRKRFAKQFGKLHFNVGGISFNT